MTCRYVSIPHHRVPRLFLVAVATLLLSGMERRASAAPGPSREQCLETFSRAQDAQSSGQVSLARSLFFTCAQATCPALVQSDCARYTDELERQQPTIAFVARDSAQVDLPDTTVYIDGVLAATRLDDGKTHDIDPGRHTLRFVNGGRDVSQTVVVNQGEKGRSVMAVFPAPGGSGATGPNRSSAPTAHRSAFPLVIAGVGVAAMATGAVLTVVGLGKVPDTCTLGTRECAVPPGDASLSTAKSGVSLANVGIVVGAAGFVATVAGLVWYMASPKVMETAKIVTPWFGDRAAGVAFTGRM